MLSGNQDFNKKYNAEYLAEYLAENYFSGDERPGQMSSLFVEVIIGLSKRMYKKESEQVEFIGDLLKECFIEFVLVSKEQALED